MERGRFNSLLHAKHCMWKCLSCTLSTSPVQFPPHESHVMAEERERERERRGEGEEESGLALLELGSHSSNGKVVHNQISRQSKLLAKTQEQ